MGLPPSEFERLTYAELRFYLEGCETKLKRESEARLEHNAWLAATLINWLGTFKETIQPAVLLGRQKLEPKKSRDEQLEDALSVAYSQYVRADAE
jgi:hypothetical protein